jgi:hypothetical protein
MSHAVASLALNLITVFLGILGARAFWEAIFFKGDETVRWMARAWVLVCIGLALNSTIWGVFRIAQIAGHEDALSGIAVVGAWLDLIGKGVPAAGVFCLLKAKLAAVPLSDRPHWTVLTVPWFNNRRSLWVRLLGCRYLRRLYKWRK